MASERNFTPVILCGKGEEIATRVIAGLRPEYEVVHFIESSDACISEIPAILNGQMPSNPNSTLGTGNISDRPVAVILGGGFDDAFDMVYNEVERALGPSGSGVPWLRNDTNKPGPGDLGPGYGTVAAQRMKQVLGELRIERQSGLIRTGPTGVYWY